MHQLETAFSHNKPIPAFPQPPPKKDNVMYQQEVHLIRVTECPEINNPGLVQPYKDTNWGTRMVVTSGHTLFSLWLSPSWSQDGSSSPGHGVCLYRRRRGIWLNETTPLQHLSQDSHPAMSHTGQDWRMWPRLAARTGRWRCFNSAHSLMVLWFE